MNARLQLANQLRRMCGWLIPVGLLALMPKCVLCLLAYAGLGGALIRSAPEFCGATNGSSAHWDLWLMAAGITLVLTGFFRSSNRCQRTFVMDD